MCGDSNRFPFLHREGGGDMSWRKCREISESEKKKEMGLCYNPNAVPRKLQ
jgi:hypothetical protein